MFWRDPKGLNSIPVYSKVGISILLIVAGVGYLLGFATIFTTYAPIDEKPGMSVADIRIAFYGSREKTRLEKSIDGSMRQYFVDQEGYEQAKEWIATGAKKEDFPRIKQVFDLSCNTCHSAEAQVAGVVTAEYDDVAAYLRGVARNLIRLSWRRQSRAAKATEHAAREIARRTVDRDLDEEPDRGDEFIKALKLCVEGLADRAKSLVHGYYFENTSPTELARAARQSAASMRMALMRIRRQLRTCVEARVPGARI